MECYSLSLLLLILIAANAAPLDNGTTSIENPIDKVIQLLNGVAASENSTEERANHTEILRFKSLEMHKYAVVLELRELVLAESNDCYPNGDPKSKAAPLFRYKKCSLSVDVHLITKQSSNKSLWVFSQPWEDYNCIGQDIVNCGGCPYLFTTVNEPQGWKPNQTQIEFYFTIFNYQESSPPTKHPLSSRKDAQVTLPPNPYENDSLCFERTVFQKPRIFDDGKQKCTEVNIPEVPCFFNTTSKTSINCGKIRVKFLVWWTPKLPINRPQKQDCRNPDWDPMPSAKHFYAHSEL